METQLRAALVDWLRSDTVLQGKLNAIEEAAPIRATIPWLGIVASASIDWSTKDRRGREIRVALELHLRGDHPRTGADFVTLVENRVEEFPSDHQSFFVASIRFLRARAEKRAGNIRAILLEYRFRLLES